MAVDVFIKRMDLIGLRAKPVMLGVIQWPYLDRRWSVEQRFNAIATHHEIIFKQKFLNLRSLSSNAILTLMTFDEISKGVYAGIDQPPWFSREGEIVVNLFKDDLRVVSISLTLGIEQESVVAYIGAVQGIHNGIPKQESLQIFKELTKDFKGLRPRSLLLEIVKTFAKELSAEKLLGVSEEHRHHLHSYFKGERKIKVGMDYNAFWEDHQGTLDEVSGFYEVPLKLNVKDISTVVSKKRSQYRKRNQIIESIDASIKIENININMNDNAEKDVISSTVPDWSREHKPFYSWEPSRSLIASIRTYQSIEKIKNPIQFLIKKIAVLRHRFWSVVTGAEIPLNSKIGGGLLIPHPNGIVIHPAAKIGPNCLILQQVTISDNHDNGSIDIKGHVDIGAGAKILSNVSIGEHAKIGANAVVVNDVPANKTAVGVPARVI